MRTMILILVGLFLLLFWLWQLLDLMNRGDDEFPGRFDKLIWGMILLFGWVVGAVAFCLWKVLAETQRQADSVVQHVGGLIQESNDKPGEPGQTG